VRDYEFSRLRGGGPKGLRLGTVGDPEGREVSESVPLHVRESLVRSWLELVLHLVDATYQSRNAGSLSSAAREVNRIRYLVRLAKDLRVTGLDRSLPHLRVGQTGSVESSERGELPT